MHKLFLLMFVLALTGCGARAPVPVEHNQNQTKQETQPEKIRERNDLKVQEIENQESLDSFDAAFRQGLTYYGTGNHSAALICFKKALEFKPKSAPAYLLKGRIHNLLGQYAEAEQTLTEAIRLDPKSGEAYNVRALARWLLHKNKESLTDADTAVRLAPDLAEARRNRASLYRGQGLVIPRDEPSTSLRYHSITLATAAISPFEALTRPPEGNVLNLRPASDWTYTLAFSPDGKTVATVGEDLPRGEPPGKAVVRLYDRANGAPRARLEGHAGAVYTVAYTRDGKMLATGGEDGTVRLWDAASGQPHCTLKGHVGSVNSVCFSPNARLLASGGDDGTVKLWAVAERKERAGFMPSGEPVRAVAFSPDGATLAVGGGYAKPICLLWDVEKGRIITNLKEHLKTVLALAFAPDGKTLASAGLERTIQLWDLTTGKPRAVLSGHKNDVTSLAFAPDSKLLVSTEFFTNTVLLWDAIARKERGALNVASGDLWQAVAFAPDGRWIATGGLKAVKLWEVSEGSPNVLPPEQRAPIGPGVTVLQGHQDVIKAVAYSSDGRWLASGAHDHTVRIWSASDLKLKTTLQQGLDHVRALAFSPDNRTLAVANYSLPEVTLWKVETGERQAALPDAGAEIVAVAFAPDGKTVACGYTREKESFVILWNYKSGQECGRLIQKEGPLQSLVFAADGKTLAIGGSRTPTEDVTDYKTRGVVTIWDWTKGKRLTSLEDVNGSVTSVVFSGDGSTLAWAGWGTASLWSLAERKRTILDLSGVTINSLAFSADNRLLALGHNEKSICLWDRTTESLRCLLGGHTDHVEAVAFAPDGRHLASGSRDNSVRVWDVPVAGPANQLTDLQRFHYPGSLDTLAISSDGFRLAVGGSAGTVVVWDLTARPVKPRELSGHTQPVHDLVFSPDRKLLASASESDKDLDLPGEIKLWDSATGKELHTLKGFPGGANGVVFLSDSKVLISSHRTKQDSAVRFWNTVTGNELAAMKSPDEIFSLAVSLDGKFLVTGGSQQIKFYELPPVSEFAKLGNNGLICRATIPTPHLWILKVAFTSDGKTLAAGGGVDMTTTLWDVASRKQIARFAGSRFALTPDGKTIATAATKENFLQPLLWEVHTGKQVIPMRSAHTDLISALAFSPSGERLVTVGHDGAVKCFDPRTGGESWFIVGNKPR